VIFTKSLPNPHERQGKEVLKMTSKQALNKILQTYKLQNDGIIICREMDKIIEETLNNLTENVKSKTLLNLRLLGLMGNK